MAEVASAFVTIIPSYKGGTAGISKLMAADADRAGEEVGRSAGSKFGKAFKIGAAGLTVGLGAIFKTESTSRRISSPGPRSLRPVSSRPAMPRTCPWAASKTSRRRSRTTRTNRRFYRRVRKVTAHVHWNQERGRQE